MLLRLLGALALSLGAWYLIRRPYTRMMVWGGAGALSFISGMPASEILHDEGDRFLLDTGLEAGGRKITRQIDPRQLYAINLNLALFGTLALLTPWRRLRAHWRWFLLSGLILASSHILFFTMAIHGQIAALYEANGIAFQSPGMTRAVAILVQAYSLTLGLILPLLLLAPTWLRRKERPRRKWTPAAGRSAPGRNDPCPCGSGRKYKRCCGG